MVTVLKAFGFENDPGIKTELFLQEKKIICMGSRQFGLKSQLPFQALNLKNVIRQESLMSLTELKLI